MNKVIMTIRLTKDAEVRYTPNNMAIAHFNGACSRSYKKEGQPEADFFNFVAFGKTAETIEKYVKKGTKIVVEGELNNNNYEKDGVKHYADQIVVNSFEFCESKKAEEKPQDDSNGFMSLDGIEEEIPFA